MQHAWDGGEIHTKFWSEKLKSRGRSKYFGLHVRIILKWILLKQGGKVWT